MTRITRRGFLTAGAFVAPTISAVTQAAASASRQHLHDLDPREKRAMGEAANAFIAAYRASGISVAIARGGNLVYAEAFGVADHEGDTLTPLHRLRIASVSKPITSVAIMGLIEQSRLGLSERVFGKGAILGTRYGANPYRADVEQITVEHLLTHTAGGWSNQGPGPDPMFTHPGMNHAALISWALDHVPLDHMPGEHYAYSNFGYCVLGRIIERRSGAAYADYVRDNVLLPCGIRSMEIAGNTLNDRKPLESVYFGQSGESPYNMQVSRMDAHGGWIATPTDLVRLLVRVDGFKSKPDILKRATIGVMTMASAANAGYAKGWLVNRQGNWWHNGSLPGTTSLMVRTSGGMCWAALMNTSRPNSQIGVDLDRLIWNMVGKVTLWPTTDLFSGREGVKNLL